jgi:hypothetical protein
MRELNELYRRNVFNKIFHIKYQSKSATNEKKKR